MTLITATLPFGPLLKTLRKQAGMTQRDLAAALGYSESLICSLEKAQRQPDLQAVTARFIPALGLQDDPLGYALWAYADRLIEYGQFAPAIPLLKESLAIFQARGSRYELSNCLGTLGRLALLQGDVTQAHQRLYEAVAISTEFNYHEMLGWLQAFLGLATLYHGTISDARRILIENHTFCTDLKDKGLVARNSIYLAETFLAEGLVDEAEQWLNQSFAYFSNPRRIRIDQLERLLVVACLAAAKQHYLRAATLFGLVQQISSHLDYVVTGPRRAAVDTALVTVRAVLEPAVFAEAFAKGQQLSLEEAFATILAPASVQNQDPQASEK